MNQLATVDEETNWCRRIERARSLNEVAALAREIEVSRLAPQVKDYLIVHLALQSGVLP